MRTSRVSFVIVALLLMSLFSTGVAAAPSGPAQHAPIWLKADVFSPGLGEQPDIPPGLTIAGYGQGQRGYYLVQFVGPVEQAWKDALEARGAEIVAYVPDFAFKVRMNPGQARQVENLAEVNWVGLFHPAYKLSPELVRDGAHLFTVRVERGADAGQTAAAIAQSGARILGREGQMLMVAADSAQLDAIAHVLDVAWVENFLLYEKHNEYGAGVIMGADAANTNGYDGSTQTVAVADTGLGDGTEAGAHPDIPDTRIHAINNWRGADDSCWTITDDGAIDVDSGHGSHVSASVLGDGGANNVGKGTAPAARLVFQAIENWADMKGLCGALYPDGYYLTGIPSDLRQLFQQAYDQGARVHSNSWGSDANGDYTANSAHADDFIWTHQDMTITFSAGNSGADANNDGAVDNDSIGAPATAKNVITVGASENDRNGNYPCDTNLTYESHDPYQTNSDGSGKTCSEMGGNNDLGTGSRWGFTAEPLVSDPTAGNDDQMALFSSRGPTDDGRVKPDVVAPGTWILSGYSDLYQEQYEGDPVNSQNGLYQWDGWGMPASADYKWMGGTSMSNPLTAGGAAVVRDFYQKAFGANASAALTKATLINSAVDMLDENNDGANDNDFKIPNVHEGWGRVNLSNATDGSHQYVENTTGLATNGSVAHQFEVSTSGQPFKVTLVWSDYPSTESASKNLVNDLDLKVTAPDGTTVYLGNVFSDGWTPSGGSADRTNNVENVYVQSAATGTWKVEVLGYNVPNGPQPFALVVDAAFGAPDSAPTVSIIEPGEDATVSGSSVPVEIGASDTEDAAGTLTVEWNVDGGAWQATTYDNGTGTYKASWVTTALNDGTHTFNARATDSAGNTASDSHTVTVDNPNNSPVVSFTYACTERTCDLDGSGSTDSDGTISSYNWNFGDGTTGSGATIRHTYAADGTYTVTLTVTDNDGDSGVSSQAVTVSGPAVSTTHVGDLDRSSTNNGGTWTAVVTVTVHDNAENPVSGASVSGTWTVNGSTFSGSCSTTTDANGKCIVSRSGIAKRISSVTFSVGNVTHSTLNYNSSANHDPDGDSNGTSITVFKP